MKKINKKAAYFVTFFAVVLLANISFCNAQKIYRKELSLTTDNDAYLLQIKDGYYSSGINLNYKIADTNTTNKKVHSFFLGHQIYTPQGRKFYLQYGIDRPFAGYLFLGYNRSIATQNTYKQTGVQMGTIGPNALAKPVQDFLHSLLNFKKFEGWEKQINNELNINGNFIYGNILLPKKKIPFANIVPTVEVNVGNAFANIKASSFFCLGKMNGLNNSALFNTTIGNNIVSKNLYELFIFWQPQVVFQGFNATVEGGLFGNKQTGVVGEIEPFMYQQSWGLVFSKKQFTTKVIVVYQTKESTAQQRPQQYGSLVFSWRW